MQRKTLFIITISLLSIIFIAARIFYTSQQSLVTAKDQAIEMIKDKVQFKSISDFYWYNTDKTYYSLAGVDQNDQAIYAIVSPETKELVTLVQDQVVNEEDARSITVQDKAPLKVLSARLGMIGEEPVWEVNYQMTSKAMGYYYISAKTGKWIKDIENI
ncbi:cell wall elongation regulator TseB-like domain-containing protein [Granulicatella seriolae]|uniref:DUF5590 domain-containing protein n=1 Tax=Granulicatella seriolae TaxID=2967226 RepID=A0ABT1WN10_9LACT|nr:DUF5590 domain-containing protein [Granulicatella seriolae]